MIALAILIVVIVAVAFVTVIARLGTTEDNYYEAQKADFQNLGSE